MGRSTLFLAATTLLAALLLSLFALSVLPKRKPSDAGPAGSGIALSPQSEPKVDFGNPARGPKDAAVTIVEFGDYECAPCAEVESALAKVAERYRDDVRIVWKDLPNPAVHRNALSAAIAARCAGLQDAFWPYHDLLLKNQAAINPGAFPIFAGEVGIDETEFSACLAEQRTSPLIERDVEEAVRLGIDATPAFFINDRRVTGILTFEQFESFIAAAKAGANDAAAAPAP